MQRGNELKRFRFMADYYLVSVLSMLFILGAQPKDQNQLPGNTEQLQMYNSLTNQHPPIHNHQRHIH